MMQNRKLCWEQRRAGQKKAPSSDGALLPYDYNY